MIASLGFLSDLFILFAVFIQPQWMTEETFKIVTDRQEAKVISDRRRIGNAVLQ